MAALLGLIAASPARAQTSPARPATPAIDNRIPLAALDLRGVFAFLGKDPITATGLFLAAENLPSKAFGLSGGAHVYPVRGRAWALGLGAEAIVVRNSLEPIDLTTKKPTGDVFKRRLRGVSGQLSLNFGHKAGWSYLTAGLGPMSFESYLEKTTVIPDGLRTTTLNFGGGARWFNFDHLAFTIDMRFYRTKAAIATLHTAPRDSHSVVVLSAGMSIK